MPKLFKRLIEKILLSCFAQHKEAQLLKKELESNLLDYKEQLVAQGIKPHDAEKKVVQRFGDPAIIGKMFLKKGKYGRFFKLANIIAFMSFSIGLYYWFNVKFLDIRYWGMLAAIGGIAAFVATKLVPTSKKWHYGAIVGFSFLTAGQALALWGGTVFLEKWQRYCAGGDSLQSPTVLCIRSNELFFGLAIHCMLFGFCLWAIYELLVSRRIEKERVSL